MKNYSLILSATTALMFGACDSATPMVNLGIDDSYYVARMQKLSLHPALTGDAYRWYMVEDNGQRTLLSESRDYIFLSAKEGTYRLEFEIIDPDTPYSFDFTIHVLHEEVEYSPYISEVVEYRPAPGQFINEMPRYEEGDSYADILKKCTECINGTNDVMISLGAYGGYVTFAFDHTVVNVPGEMDLRIWGNCFYELTQPDKKGGSAEPGIVCVSYDVNCNGLPDDPWYELAGSDYSKASTLHNYSITYHRPAQSGDNIAWEDSEGISSALPRNTFHSQSYWPQWIADSSLTFGGSCLAPNGVDVSGNGSYYVLYSLDWGYADNHPNDYFNLNSFDIGNAVNEFGIPVDLPGADFVRVYTGVNQYCGWLGETSTEICRAQDLHIPPKSSGLTQ